MTPALPCLRCAHYFGDGKCAAFRLAIPLEIIDGKNDHRGPVKGDGGIRYAERGGDPGDYFDAAALAKVAKRLGAKLED